jgi:hypothetical protein
MAAVALFAIASIALHLHSSLELGRGIDIFQYDNGIFDLDASRVVADWTDHSAWAVRISVHPLYKLAMAPLVDLVEHLVPGERESTDIAEITLPSAASPGALLAVRILIALGITITVLLAGCLTYQLTRGAAIPSLLTGVVAVTSFSSMLLGAIPDTASVSGIATLLPLIYLNRRIGATFDLREAVCWGLLGVLGFALTISQLMHWAIALGVRILPISLARWRSGAPLLTGRALWLAAGVAGTLVLVTQAGFVAQRSLYPRAVFSARALMIETDFLELDHLRHDPVERVGAVVLQVFVHDFAAPQPGYSDFIRRYPLDDYWTLSLTEASIGDWRPGQRLLFPLIAAGVLLGLASLRKSDIRFLAPGLCVAAQLAMHTFYGKEPIIYSPNFHGVLVALVISASWTALPRMRRWVGIAWLMLSLAMLGNNLSVLEQMYRELDYGLDGVLRGNDGTPRSPLPH